MLQVDYLVVADWAAVAEGKHYIQGAGWDTLFAQSFPVVHQAMSVAVRIRVPWTDTNVQHVLELDIIDADGRSILPEPPGTLRAPLTMGRPAHIPSGNDQVAPIVFNLHRVQFGAPGAYAIVLRVEGQDAARSPFQVRGAPGR